MSFCSSRGVRMVIEGLQGLSHTCLMSSSHTHTHTRIRYLRTQNAALKPAEEPNDTRELNLTPAFSDSSERSETLYVIIIILMQFLSDHFIIFSVMCHHVKNNLMFLRSPETRYNTLVLRMSCIFKTFTQRDCALKFWDCVISEIRCEIFCDFWIIMHHDS